jgi:oligopeptide transport system substrate-binding protein
VIGRRGRRWSAPAVVAVCLSVVACTGTPPPPDDPDTSGTVSPTETEPVGGTLRIGIGADPQTLDPRFVADEEGELVVGAVFEPLVRLGPGGRPLPAAASSWEVSDDGTTFTFALRDGATFHDGDPVVAGDFVRSFTRIADGTAEPPSFLGYLLEPVLGAAEAREGSPLAGVTAVDSSTLRIELSSPQPRFLVTLADPSLVPVPEVADRDPQAFASQPIGNGPFAVAGPPQAGGFVRLASVPDHHRAARLDEVLFQVYPDDPARDRQWEDLEDGLLQVAELGADHREEAVDRFGASPDGVSGTGVLDGPTSRVLHLGFARTQAPYDDAVVRRAISQSIDRDALADEVLGGTHLPAAAIVPEGIPGSQVGACDHCRTDPEGAAALLEDAEVELPDALTFTHTRGATNAAIAERVAEDVAAALGVEVDTEPLDLEAFVPAVRGGEAPWYRLGWEANVPDPGAYLEPLFHSRNVGGDNLTGYADEETDELLDAARAAVEPTAAHEAFQAAERRILDDVALIPLLVERRAMVVVPGVEGLFWEPTGQVDLTRVRLTEPV